MKVFMILKCGLIDAFNFINQISIINSVSQVIVFRDEISLSNPKVKYITALIRSNSLLKQGSRFLQILYLARKRPSVIIGIYEIPHGLLAVVVGKILNIPSVVSIIGNPGYTKIRNGIWLKTMLWIIRKSKYVTVTGTKSKEFLIMKGINPNKVYVLPNTIDFSPFSSINIEKKYDLISLGRLSEEKHVDVFVRLVHYLKAHYNENIKAAIGGVGPSLVLIKNLISELNLGSNIEMWGYVPDDQLRDFYNSGKVFVLTSETEGFPRTIIQAAACGVPMVVSDVGDISDIVEHTVNGFLVSQYDDVEKYSEHVISLFENDVVSKQFSTGLLKLVKERFSVESASKVWNEIIKSLNK